MALGLNDHKVEDPRIYSQNLRKAAPECLRSKGDFAFGRPVWYDVNVQLRPNTLQRPNCKTQWYANDTKALDQYLIRGKGHCNLPRWIRRTKMMTFIGQHHQIGYCRIGKEAKKGKIVQAIITTYKAVAKNQPKGGKASYAQIFEFNPKEHILHTGGRKLKTIGHSPPGRSDQHYTKPIENLPALTHDPCCQKESKCSGSYQYQSVKIIVKIAKHLRDLKYAFGLLCRKLLKVEGLEIGHIFKSLSLHFLTG